MSKSRFGNRALKSQEASARAFARDVEERPSALVEVVRSIGEGNYSRSAYETAARIVAGGRDVESRLAIIVGELRYGLPRPAAIAAWNLASLGARRAAERTLQSVADEIRRGAVAPPSVPAHTAGKYRTVDLAMGVDVRKRAAAAPSRGLRMHVPPGMRELRPGVYRKKS